jgi:hypothetical protein
LAGVGTRIVAERRGPRGLVRSVLTVYDALPWVDVLNQAEAAGEAPLEYWFAPGFTLAAMEWEVPAGVARGAPPCDLSYLRWVRLSGRDRWMLFGSLEAATARVDEAGVLSSYSPSGASHYRLAVRTAANVIPADDPWRFGWGLESCLAAPVPGTGGATLPSYGRLLVTDQAGVAVVGLQPAEDGNGAIVYLQELSGRARLVTLGGGILGFADARRVDLVERDLGPPVMTMRNGVGVRLSSFGLAAVRLTGLTRGRP